MARYLMSGKGELRRNSTDSARILMILGASIVLALILAIPVTWLTLTQMSDRQLERLSNIGQAYGLLAAVISTLGLIAVAAALALQARHGQDDRLDRWRRAHAETLQMVFEQPSLYGPCMIDTNEFESEDELRQWLWTTKYLIYVRLGMEAGHIPEKAVRAEICKSMFASPTARKLWVRRRDWLIAAFGDLGSFYSILEDEHQKALGGDLGNGPMLHDSVTNGDAVGSDHSA